MPPAARGRSHRKCAGRIRKPKVGGHKKKPRCGAKRKHKHKKK